MSIAAIVLLNTTPTTVFNLKITPKTVFNLNTTPTAVYHLNTTPTALSLLNTTTHAGVSDHERLEYLQQLQDETTRIMLPSMIFLVLLAVLGLVGNCLVLWVYSRRFKTNPTRLLIITLACLDLVANVGAIPGEIYDMFHTWDFDNPHLCRARLFVNSFTTLSSGVALMAIAVIRYRKICRPHSWQASNHQAKFTCLGVCLLGAVFSVPYLVTNGRQTKRTPRPDIVGYECSEDDSYKNTLLPTLNNAFFLLLFLVCFGVMVVLYVKIGLAAWRSGKVFSNLKLVSKSDLGTDSGQVETSKAPTQSSSFSHVAGLHVTGDNSSGTYCTQLDSNETAAKQTYTETKHISELNESEKTHLENSAKFSKTFKEFSGPYCQVENSFHSCETEIYCENVLDEKHKNVAKQITQSIVRNSSPILETQFIETGLNQEGLFVNSTFQCVTETQKNSTGNVCYNSFGLPIAVCTGQETVDNVVRNGERDDHNRSINTKPQMDPRLEFHHCLLINKQENAETEVKSNFQSSFIDLNIIDSKDDIITNQPAHANIRLKRVELGPEQQATKDITLNTSPHSPAQVSTSSGTINITSESQDLVSTSPGNINIAPQSHDIVTTRTRTLNSSPISPILISTRPRTLSRTTSILIIISTVFAICYLPFIALFFFTFMDPNSYENLSAAESSCYNLFSRFYFINAAVNPIVYSLCGGKFSQECLRLLKCK